jgi:hypothetical protein
MRQLAERYVCDRGRLVVECLSCGKRKEDAAEESNPAGYGSAFLVPAVRDRLRHRPWQPKQHPTHRKSGDCSYAKDDPYVMSTLSRRQRSYGRLYDGQGKDVLQGDHGFFHTIGSC